MSIFMYLYQIQFIVQNVPLYQKSDGVHARRHRDTAPIQNVRPGVCGKNPVKNTVDPPDEVGDKKIPENTLQEDGQQKMQSADRDQKEILFLYPPDAPPGVKGTPRQEDDEDEQEYPFRQKQKCARRFCGDHAPQPAEKIAYLKKGDVPLNDPAQQKGERADEKGTKIHLGARDRLGQDVFFGRSGNA